MNERDAHDLTVTVAGEAAQAFGPRLLAVYVLGSLAHGGFSAPCNDVDVAFVLADPLQPDDAETVASVATRVAALRFADRLSLFWGTPATLLAALPALRAGRRHS